MNVNQFTTMVEALTYLQSQGFSCSFVSREEGLFCLEKQQTFQPEELTVVGYHRFEGNKDLGDVTVLYAVTREPDLKGGIIDAYGPYADPSLTEYIQRLSLNLEGGKS